MEQMVQGILVVNTETIPGMMITETLGVVSGSTVRAKNIGRDFTIDDSLEDRWFRHF